MYFTISSTNSLNNETPNTRQKGPRAVAGSIGENKGIESRTAVARKNILK